MAKNQININFEISSNINIISYINKLIKNVNNYILVI